MQYHPESVLIGEVHDKWLMWVSKVILDTPLSFIVPSVTQPTEIAAAHDHMPCLVKSGVEWR